jgi:hypothetical protein
MGAHLQSGAVVLRAEIGIPNIENAEEDYLHAMRIFGKKWKRGSLADGGPHVELLRCGFYKLSILCQHLLGLIERVNDQPPRISGAIS